LSNMNDNSDVSVSYEGKMYFLPNHTVAIVRPASSEVLFNSSELEVPAEMRGPYGGRKVVEAVRTSDWVQYKESPADGTESQSSAKGPIEQLHLTGGQAAVTGYFSDYLWYTTNIPKAADGKYTVRSKSGSGSILYHYVDGVLLPSQMRSTAAAQRHGDEGVDEHAAYGHVPTTDISMANGDSATLQILSVAMGLYNGGVGPKSIKGVTAANVNGVDVTNNSWGHTWLSPAEGREVWLNPDAVPWSPVVAGGDDNTSLAWFKTTFDMPGHQAAQKSGPNQVSYALSLVGANKGVAFVNGFELGRYWLEPGSCSGACAPPIKSGHCYMHWKDCGEPTQTLYHIPTPIMRPADNVVVIYEETAAVAPRDLREVKIVQLQNHA